MVLESITLSYHMSQTRPVNTTTTVPYRKYGRISELLKSRKYKQLNKASIEISRDTSLAIEEDGSVGKYEDVLYALEVSNTGDAEMLSCRPSVATYSDVSVAVDEIEEQTCLLKKSSPDNEPQAKDKKCSIPEVKVASEEVVVWHRGIPRSTESRPRAETGISIPQNLTSVSVEELLRWVLRGDAVVGTDTMDVFLLTFRKFIQAELVLAFVIQEYNRKESNVLMLRTKLQKRVLFFLKKWKSCYPEDFQGNSRLCIELRAFLTVITWDDPAKMLQCKPLLASLWDKNTMRREMGEVKTQGNIGYLRYNRVREEFILLSPAEMARQITEKDLKEFQSLKRVDLLNTASSMCFKLYANRVNKVVEWIVTSVIHCDKEKRRHHCIRKFIKLGKEFHSLGNYNGLFSVITGLAYPNITGLHAPWTEVGEKHISALDKLNKAAVVHKQCLLSNNDVQCTKDDVVLPSIGAFLNYVTECTPKDGTIGKLSSTQTVNFEVMKKLYTVIINLERYQNKDPKKLFKHAGLLKKPFKAWECRVF